jgi:hypothetical protein
MARIRTKDGRTLEVSVHRKYNVRDQLGHWVAPSSMRQHPCPHKCCQGKRVHPENLPVKLDRSFLRGLSEKELETELGEYISYSDTHEEGLRQVMAELDRREASGKRAEARKTRAKERARSRQDEYRDEVYRQWLMAENATNGYMLNKAGKAADIDERSLFTGPESRVKKYASPELYEWFESHPRPTRVSWYGNAKQRRAHLSGSRI